MTTNKLKSTCAVILLAGIAAYFAGCSKDEKSSSSSSGSNSSSFIPTESAVMAKLKNFSFASTSTTTTSEAQKILTFLGSDVDIHTVTSAPGVICGEYKSGYHLALLPGGAAYAAYYGMEDNHSFLTSTTGTAFTIDPATAGGGSGTGTGGTGAGYAIFYYDNTAGAHGFILSVNGVYQRVSNGTLKVINKNWGSSAPDCSTAQTLIPGANEDFDPQYNVLKVALTQTTNTWEAQGLTSSGSTKTFGSTNLKKSTTGCVLVEIK